MINPIIPPHHIFDEIIDIGSGGDVEGVCGVDFLAGAEVLGLDEGFEVDVL